MARVPAVELERLKRDVSVRRLAEAKGVTFKKSGEDNFVGRCCFHEDKTPSLVVSEKKNVWHCLGACRTGGGPIDFVMKAEGVTFRHAVELLREGVDFSRPRPVTAPKLACPLTVDAADATLLREVRDYYRQQLEVSTEALAYLETRGLKHAGLIEEFHLGFANRTLGLRLPEANRVDGAKLRGRLQALGVYRESGHEHLNGSLVVPIHDEDGAVVGMYGRKVTDNLRTGTPKHLYLPGPHRAAFNSAGLATGNGVAIVCEALLDAMSFWVAGFRNVTSAYGVAGFTPHHLEALKRHGVRDVLVAYDRDEAGDAAAVVLGTQLEAEGFDCYRVRFPYSLDANDVFRKVKPGAKALGTVLRGAAFMGNGAPRRVPDFSSLVASAATVAVPGGLEEGKRVAPTLAAKAVAVNDTAVPVAPDTSVAARTTAQSASAALAAIAAAQGKVSDVARAANTASANTGQTITTPANTTPANTAPTNTTQANTQSDAVTEDEAVFHFGPRKYRVRGLAKAHGTETLRFNVLLGVGDVFHVDTFDLYSAKARQAFVAQAALECRVDGETLKRDVGQLLLRLEALLEKRRADAAGPKAPTLSDEERDEALALLRAPDLLQRVLEDFTRCGVVGEETNKLVGYLAAVSRKLEEPLAVLIQSSSAAGKSSLMEAVLAFVPEEEKTKYSAMTGQSLFYMGDSNLKHKVLAVVEEEGASRASYALKLLQSEGELTIASTGKDPHTGRLVTHEYHVEGPTQLFLTTTASELDEELLNRCLVLTVDEDKTQTSAIHRLQRERRTLEGRLARKERDGVLKVHQDAQRLLRALTVVNPYARALAFPADRTRARRDFPKYLTLIDAIALLHQYQRPVKTATKGGHLVEYIEVTAEDIAAANRLAAAVLSRSLDELPPQTRRLLQQVDDFVTARATETKQLKGEVRFTRREVREVLGWGDTQLYTHLTRLVRLELLAQHRTAHGACVYQLLHEGDVPSLGGLTDVADSGHDYDGQNSAPIRGAFGVVSAAATESTTTDTDGALSSGRAAFGAAAVAHSTREATS